MSNKHKLILLLVAGSLIPTSALAWPKGDANSGFYFGAGVSTNIADLDTRVRIRESSNTLVSLRNVTGGIEIDQFEINALQNDDPVRYADLQPGRFPFALPQSSFTPFQIKGSLLLTADEATAFGGGFHVGYKATQRFSIEFEYATLGEFTAISNLTNFDIADDFEIAPDGLGTEFEAPNRITVRGFPEALTHADNPGVVYFYLDDRDPGGANPLGSTRLTGTLTAAGNIDVVTGSVISKLPLDDKFSIYGRFGYFMTTVSEDPATWEFEGDVCTTALPRTNCDGTAKEVDLAGTMQFENDVIDDANGILYGAGVELIYGSRRQIIVHGDMQVLANGFAGESDISRFSLQASYKF